MSAFKVGDKVVRGYLEEIVYEVSRVIELQHSKSPHYELFRVPAWTEDPKYARESELRAAPP